MSELTVEIHPDRASWLGARSNSIGSSDTPHLLGADCPGGTRGWLDLWLCKNPAARERVGLKVDADEDGGPQSLRFAVGHALEPVIEQHLREREDLEIVDPGPFTIHRSTSRPWLHSSLDGIVGSIDSPRIVCSYKTLEGDQAYKWEPGDPDLYAYLQVQHDLHLPGMEHVECAYLAALVGLGRDPRRDFLVYRIEREPRIGELIQEVWERFRGFVERDEEPPVDGLESTTKALRLLYPAKAKDAAVHVTLGAQWVAKQLRFDQLKKEIERAEREKRQISQEIEYEMGQNGATNAMVPAAPELPKGRHWYRYSITPKPTCCPACSAVVAQQKPSVRCQPTN